MSECDEIVMRANFISHEFMQARTVKSVEVVDPLLVVFHFDDGGSSRVSGYIVREIIEGVEAQWT